jgi:hypothetical protein
MSMCLSSSQDVDVSVELTGCRCVCRTHKIIMLPKRRCWKTEQTFQNAFFDVGVRYASCHDTTLPSQTKIWKVEQTFPVQWWLQRVSDQFDTESTVTTLPTRLACMPL